MIHLKSTSELKTMKVGGQILTEIRDILINDIKKGITPKQIEKKACELIKKTGGEPSFKRVQGYHWATCINVNDIVVHGIPNDTPFSEGDIVGIDVGLFYKGFHTDTSWTVPIEFQNTNDKAQKHTLKIDKFLHAGEKALEKGLKQIKVGNRIGHISQAMQKVIEGAGYTVVEELVGHGIGRELHEDPEVPGMLLEPIFKTDKIVPGLALAIEIIYSAGNSDIIVDDDNWTIRTKDGTISGLFEKTVIVDNHGVFVVT